MAFKQDDDFLRFITMGAAGSAAVARFLSDEHGHRMVELERYAMANKIWATKIKRLRLADLVCLDCGMRVEARAKSKLEIRMSHSDRPGREWDAGLRDEDLCAFIVWNPEECVPSERPACFTVGAMREAAPYARLGPRKSPSQGAERDMTWPAAVPKRDAIVEEVDYSTGRIKVNPTFGSRQTYWLRDESAPVYIYVDKGEHIRGGEAFVVGCVERPDTLDCPGPVWDHIEDLDSADPIERYVAVKVAGILADEGAEDRLLVIADDDDEDARIRLEALGSLARIDPERFTRDILRLARQRHVGDRAAMAMAMETIFILSELGTDEAADALYALASDEELDSEARCAAVWGLGVAGANSPHRVLQFIADWDEDVALHALAGIGPLPPEALPQVQAMLDGSPDEAVSASVLLAAQGDAGITCLLDSALNGNHGAPWAIAGLGELPRERVTSVAGSRLTPELLRALAPLWVQRESWLRRQQMETPLQFLERQTIRHVT